MKTRFLMTCLALSISCASVSHAASVSDPVQGDNAQLFGLAVDAASAVALPAESDADGSVVPADLALGPLVSAGSWREDGGDPSRDWCPVELFCEAAQAPPAPAPEFDVPEIAGAATVPLPAALPALVSALGALGLVAARRRSGAARRRATG